MRQRTHSRLAFFLVVIGCCFSFGSAFVAPKSPTTIDRATLSPKAVQLATLAKNENAYGKQTSLLMASNNSPLKGEEEKSWQVDPLYASLWVGFIAFAALGPGELGDPNDTAILQAYIDNPADPGFSEAFQLIFNYLGLLPAVIACLAVPQASKKGLPPLPFLAASFAMGYGAVGKLRDCATSNYV